MEQKTSAFNVFLSFAVFLIILSYIQKIYLLWLFILLSSLLTSIAESSTSSL